jgi:hypothetical protein
MQIYLTVAMTTGRTSLFYMLAGPLSNTAKIMRLISKCSKVYYMQIYLSVAMTTGRTLLVT